MALSAGCGRASHSGLASGATSGRPERDFQASFPRFLSVLSAAGEGFPRRREAGTDYACSLWASDIFGRGFNSRRLHQMQSIWCPELAEGHQPELTLHYCYILCCSDDSYYVGVAEDPRRRLAEHNAGKGADWTASRLPVVIAWQEPYETLASARRRENQLKRWSHKKKAALIAGSLRLRSGQG